MNSTEIPIEKEAVLVQQGDEAQALLETAAFNQVVNQLVEASFQTFTNTKPEENQTRERAYHHYRGLVDIVNTLQQRVAVRDEINAKNDKQNSDNNGD